MQSAFQVGVLEHIEIGAHGDQRDRVLLVTRPRPRGYIGTGHQTIGSDILALYHALLLPDEVLGVETSSRIRGLDSDGWYPIVDLLEPLELLGEKLGAAGLRKVGRKLFELSHQERVRGVISSAAAIVHGLDGMYHAANRGQDIGGWKVLSFEPGEARLEKTTPHHCALEEGIVSAAMKMVGVLVNIEQPQCMRSGSDHCQFVITSVVTDARWMGASDGE